MALFGTDGVRGIAKTELTSQLIFNLSIAAAKVLAKSKNPRAIIGNDSRESATYLEAAVIAGLEKQGVEIHLAGIIPTPAIAYLVKNRGYDFGVMISASHNPMPDNGIKFFASGGEKLTDQIEQQIEQQMQQEQFLENDIAQVNRNKYLDQTAINEYLSFLGKVFVNSSQGLKVVVDCANGAASFVAPLAYEKSGAEVIAISNQPDGSNINQGCGSTHLENLIAAVKANSADLGIAHDGDADRCLLIDSNGAVVDGDQILAILAIAFKQAAKLNNNTVVTTVMSNQGFFNAMNTNQINVVRTSVGDRYVLERMQQDGFSLGGEQSGHVVVSEFATTGDGILTALLVMQQMTKSKNSLAKLASVVTKYPQVLVNVKNVDKSKLSTNSKISAEISKQSERIKTEGQILVRPSGTENLVRIMVEAKTIELANKIANEISEVVKSELGG
jgi:phosphoglucosamine mutase